MRKAFTMLELMIAVVLVGVVTAVAMATFYTVSNGWNRSVAFLDRHQRTDYAIDQLVSALRSMYYPHDGEVNSNYGFILTDNGDGTDPDRSDKIEWSKTGQAIVGTKSAVADTVHRVQVMVLEEGRSDFRDADGRAIEIPVTGLYARQCPDVALRPKENPDDIDFSFSNDEMYEPVLIADGVVGFNCRVLKDAEKVEDGKNDKRLFEDEFAESNSVPYKVELTFYLEDPDRRGYRADAAPMMRIIRIPIHEQSLDGKAPPGEDEKRSSGEQRKRGGAQ